MKSVKEWMQATKYTGEQKGELKRDSDHMLAKLKA
jgi:hypothetical protein